MPFSPCPRVHLTDAASVRAFWADFDVNPRPVRLTEDGIGEVDFLGMRGHPTADGGYQFDGAVVGGGSAAPYMLTNPAYTPAIFHGLAERFPLPRAVASIARRPVLSIGINGTGEKDIAHHFHPVTAMRLLQGRKIWALRAPTDLDCAANTADCTDPFYVCDYYAQQSAPSPACVQEPGETIVVPDGWYHGTCNNASWTVGWGFQGQTFAFSPPRCFHCRLAENEQLQYATLSERVLTTSDANAVWATLATLGGKDGHRLRGASFLSLGHAAQAPYMAFRSVFGQFMHMSLLAQEENRAMRSPDCTLQLVAAVEDDEESLSEVDAVQDMPKHAHFVLPLRGPTLEVTLRHRGSGEMERREVPLLHAAFWVGGALVSVRTASRRAPHNGVSGRRNAGSAAPSQSVLVHCRVSMPWA